MKATDLSHWAKANSGARVLSEAVAGGQMQQMELDMENQRSIMLGEVATMRQDLQVCSMEVCMSAGPATATLATNIGMCMGAATCGLAAMFEQGRLGSGAGPMYVLSQAVGNWASRTSGSLNPRILLPALALPLHAR